MATEPMIRAAAATGFVNALRVAGVDPTAVLDEAGIDASLLEDPFALLPLRAFVAAFELGANRSGIASFGLKLGLSFRPETLGALGYVVLHSPTVRAALSGVDRYFAVHQGGTALGLEESGAQTVWSYRILDPTIAPRRQDAELSIGMAVACVRAIFGQPWAPLEIWFEHAAPEDTREHRRLLGADVRFRQACNAVVVDPSLLDREMPAPDPTLLEVLQRHVDALLAERADETSLAAQVRTLIANAIAHGAPSIEAASKKMAMSGSTLRRRLREEDTTYQEQVDVVRKALAERYLPERGLSLTEIAFLLGYSDASAFTRAFKRWTGTTPLT